MTKITRAADSDGGSRQSRATVSCVGGWLRSQVTEVMKEARGLATRGRRGGLLTAAALEAAAVVEAAATLVAEAAAAKEVAAREGHSKAG